MECGPKQTALIKLRRLKLAGAVKLITINYDLPFTALLFQKFSSTLVNSSLIKKKLEAYSVSLDSSAA